MKLEHKVSLGSWDVASCMPTVPEKELVSAIVLDGVTVLFENPDGRNLVVTTVGGTPEENSRVLQMWAYVADSALSDEGVPNPPEEACELFFRFLANPRLYTEADRHVRKNKA